MNWMAALAKDSCMSLAWAGLMILPSSVCTGMGVVGAGGGGGRLGVGRKATERLRMPACWRASTAGEYGVLGVNFSARNWRTEVWSRDSLQIRE